MVAGIDRWAVDRIDWYLAVVRGAEGEAALTSSRGVAIQPAVFLDFVLGYAS